MERPQHGALDPGSHPCTATEAAHSGAYQQCNKIQMYSTVCVWMSAGMHVLGVRAHVLLTKGMGVCQQRVNAD